MKGRVHIKAVGGADTPTWVRGKLRRGIFTIRVTTSDGRHFVIPRRHLVLVEEEH